MRGEQAASSIPYVPFDGICLTDTFQMYEGNDMLDVFFPDNSERRKKQKKLDIRVIVGNPPYSEGQDSANDNNQNVAYRELDRRIRDTYVANSKAALSKGLYNSYIRAIRWASDRVGSSGIVGFVTNAGFLEANTADGLRQCLVEEFSKIYVFHLRGNQRTQGELSRKEGGKIFGSGSRAPIAMSLLVKNPNANQHGQIHFHDIGDYLSTEDKLKQISEFASIAGLRAAGAWHPVIPDEHHDWLKQRNESFSDFIIIGDKSGGAEKIFDNFSLGVATNRDAWCFNSSKSALSANVKRMIAFYNGEVDRFSKAHLSKDSKARQALVDDFVDADPSKISWTVNLKQELWKHRPLAFDENCLTASLH